MPPPPFPGSESCRLLAGPQPGPGHLPGFFRGWGPPRPCPRRAHRSRLRAPSAPGRRAVRGTAAPGYPSAPPCSRGLERGAGPRRKGRGLGRSRRGLDGRGGAARGVPGAGSSEPRWLTLGRGGDNRPSPTGVLLGLAFPATSKTRASCVCGPSSPLPPLAASPPASATPPGQAEPPSRTPDRRVSGVAEWGRAGDQTCQTSLTNILPSGHPPACPGVGEPWRAGSCGLWAKWVCWEHPIGVFHPVPQASAC